MSQSDKTQKEAKLTISVHFYEFMCKNTLRPWMHIECVYVFMYIRTYVCTALLTAICP